MSTSVALSNARRLAAQAAQIIKFRASHPTSFYHINVVNDRGVERKNSFNADTKAGLSNSDRLSGSAVFASDNHTLKGLQAFLRFRFLNANMHAHCIARLKIRNAFPQLGFFNTI